MHISYLAKDLGLKHTTDYGVNVVYLDSPEAAQEFRADCLAAHCTGMVIDGNTVRQPRQPVAAAVPTTHWEFMKDPHIHGVQRKYPDGVVQIVRFYQGDWRINYGTKSYPKCQAAQADVDKGVR